MMVLEWPPWVWYFIAAALVSVLPHRARLAVLLLTPLLGAASISTPSLTGITLFDLTLIPWQVDGTSRLFLWLFNLAALLGAIYALHVRDPLQHTTALLYAGSAMGVVGAGDWLSLFVFWELMALSSAGLICATPTALQAGYRYLLIHVCSGFMMLVGALLQLQHTDSILLNEPGLDGLAGWLLFLAMGIKCAFPLIHNWVTDAYPASTPTAAVWLSVFTTKTAVYLLARSFPGTEALIYIGAVMAVLPLFYALLENDLRRVLCYSIISQLGFMVCGIGTGGALALDAVAAHACNDVIFKSLLFMAMGSVLYRTGRIQLSTLGGLHKGMPWTTGLCMIGAASISAVPLFNGFVSKSMLMSAVLEGGHHGAWLALLFASACTLLYIGIRIPYYVFYGRDCGIRVTDPPPNMLTAMALAALLCVLIGCFPALLYQWLPHGSRYAAYDFSHVLAQLQLLGGSALAFLCLHRYGLYPTAQRGINLDAEYLYRRLLPDLLRRVTTRLSVSLRQLQAAGEHSYGHGGRRARSALDSALHHLHNSSLAIWLVTGVLTGLLLLHYLSRPV